MKILVTGGTGFAGSHLIAALLARGYIEIYSTTFTDVDPKEAILPAAHYIKVDLSQVEATRALITEVKPDWIFHLASFAFVGKSFDMARELFSNNINLALNVLDAVREICPQARILTIGSAEEYGMTNREQEKIAEDCALNPVNPYAVSKVTQDLLAGSYFLSYKMNIIRARPFNHIGIRQTGDFAIPSFVRQIVDIERGSQTALKVGSLDGVRDFSSVRDVVSAYILLMEKGTVGEVYNIGSGSGYKMSDIVAKLCALATVPITIERDESRLRPLDVPGLIADNSKMRALGWSPEIAIDEELKNVLEELRAK